VIDSVSRVPRVTPPCQYFVLTFYLSIMRCYHAAIAHLVPHEIGDDVPLTVELDRSSPVPLYYQLAQAIEAAIRDGEL
jgi:hypothetical protein